MTDQNPDREYTPTIHVVRVAYVGYIREHSPRLENRNENRAAIEFDRWLAEVKRQERETAWEECYEYMTRNRPLIARQVPDPNPYRRGEDAS